MVRKTTMNTQNVLSVSVTRVSQSVSAARSIGMSFTDRTPGTGMYILTVCMLTHSRRSVTRCGGIGAMVLTAGAGIMVGGGIVLTMLGDTLRVIGAAGMAATGVAGMVVDIGDIIIIGTAVLAGAGAVEAVGLVRLIQTVVRMDKAVTEILLLYVDMVQAPLVLVVLLFGQLVARLVPPDQLMAGEQAQQDAW